MHEFNYGEILCVVARASKLGSFKKILAKKDHFGQRRTSPRITIFLLTSFKML